ncbi:MAG: exodeoxyribonuclease III [Zetaproteobacteria bacterium CG17_big_fil_post_rev_8_21_14_2_50_50_13]|nr:MAG: exodeoxyribonuclease III [Zetaproteobacteria bacterium CG17_big_fil_post_rev_8_21_14_2_50_50_13]
MKIVTWNVNSLNVRLPHVLEFLEQVKPDVLALQETKQQDKDFPQADIEAAGYHVVFSGQKPYNGVAIVSRHEISDVIDSIPNFDDPQRRLLAVSIEGVRIVNVYIPNGQEVDSDKYRYKFRWLHAMRNYLRSEIANHEKLVLLGDYNIAPADIDVHDPQRWSGKIMCSEPERAWFSSMLEMGLIDSIRQLYPDEPMHSWWDYRMNAYRRKWGIRIDHILATPAMRPLDGRVCSEFREKERPSDHAPVCVEFA